MPLSMVAALIALGCAPTVVAAPQAGPIATVFVCPPPAIEPAAPEPAPGRGAAKG